MPSTPPRTGKAGAAYLDQSRAGAPHHSFILFPILWVPRSPRPEGVKNCPRAANVRTPIMSEDLIQYMPVPITLQDTGPWIREAQWHHPGS